MKLWMGLLFVSLAAAPFAQDQFPDVPERVYERMAGQFTIEALIHDLVQAGVVARPPWHCIGAKLTRYEQAVFIYTAYRALIEPRHMRKLGKSYGDTLADLKRATSTLEKELASMGVDVEAMKLHLKALALGQGFPDVPPTHWASKATLELKSKGLLKGYPDGLFRGD